MPIRISSENIIIQIDLPGAAPNYPCLSWLAMFGVLGV